MTNEVQIISNTIEDIRDMVEDSVKFQKLVSPVYEKISNKILSMLDKEDELAAWDAKDLLKLLELSNKAQLQPVEQLTKLIQSVQSLHERTELQNRIDNLADVVNELKVAKEESQKYVENEALDIEDIEDLKE